MTRAAAALALVATLLAAPGCAQRECACREQPMGTTPGVVSEGEEARPEPAPDERAVVLPPRPNLAALRACAERGDSVCVIRVLEGKLLTEAEMALLVEVYRELGLPRRARLHMARYVERFPIGDRADLYRQHLAFEPSP